MPNWTKNEVTFTSPFTNNIKIIKEIFEKGHPFNQLIQEPKWDEIPLKGNERVWYNKSKRYGKKGELPVFEKINCSNGDIMELKKFKSTNEQDLRWYDWRLQNWDTKWDVPKDDIEITEVNNRHIVIGFNTAWSPPISIYRKLFNKFSDVSIEWWARDEDDQTNGEGYYLT